jgi:hypothetical protein
LALTIQLYCKYIVGSVTIAKGSENTNLFRKYDLEKVDYIDEEEAVG